MKQILLFLPLIFFLLSNLNILKSQDLVVTPDDLVLDTIIDLSDQFIVVKLSSTITNNTNQGVELAWKIKQISGSSEWKSQVSVNGASGGSFAWEIMSNYDPAFPSPTPLVLDSGGNSYFDLSIRPTQVAGCGTFELTLSPFLDTTDILLTEIYTFKINVDADCNPLVSNENWNKNQVTIFPNPTTDYFSITNNSYVKSIQIFNVVGKQMAITPYQNGDVVSVANFPNGLYLVRMLDDDGDVLKTTRLAKR